MAEALSGRVLAVGGNEGGRGPNVDLPQVVGLQAPGDVDEIALKVGKFLLIDPAGVAVEPARATGEQGVF